MPRATLSIRIAAAFGLARFRHANWLSPAEAGYGRYPLRSKTL